MKWLCNDPAVHKSPDISITKYYFMCHRESRQFQRDSPLQDFIGKHKTKQTELHRWMHGCVPSNSPGTALKKTPGSTIICRIL
jgi:hypothetical protein